MADINIKDLLDRKILGNDLFSDSESFMMEINDESECIVGGLELTCYIIVDFKTNDSGTYNWGWE
jgi:hypothetical protein